MTQIRIAELAHISKRFQGLNLLRDVKPINDFILEFLYIQIPFDHGLHIFSRIIIFSFALEFEMAKNRKEEILEEIDDFPKFGSIDMELG